MKLRIVSDGTPVGSRVETEDGVPVDGVMAVAWTIEAGQMARAVVTLLRVPVELVGEAEVVVDPSGPGTRGADASDAAQEDSLSDNEVAAMHADLHYLRAQNAELRRMLWPDLAEGARRVASRAAWVVAGLVAGLAVGAWLWWWR